MRAPGVGCVPIRLSKRSTVWTSHRGAKRGRSRARWCANSVSNASVDSHCPSKRTAYASASYSSRWRAGARPAANRRFTATLKTTWSDERGDRSAGDEVRRPAGHDRQHCCPGKRSEGFVAHRPPVAESAVEAVSGIDMAQRDMPELVRDRRFDSLAAEFQQSRLEQDRWLSVVVADHPVRPHSKRRPPGPRHPDRYTRATGVLLQSFGDRGDTRRRDGCHFIRGAETRLVADAASQPPATRLPTQLPH